MFHPLIAKGRDQWLARPDCPARGLLRYMRDRGALRPVQIDALATYLFLKLRCGNAPLWKIFMDGRWRPRFADEDEWEHSREELEAWTEAAPALRLLRAANAARGSDACETNFRTLFYDVAYPDYLFSLPMGAGKTYLMAAMIYLNLYFAEQNPADLAFAHNFLVLAPSGTKSSIVPSLRTIRDFDPSWVLPPEDARRLRREVSFEVLDAGASAARSNRTRNPNAQKIMAHAPLDRCFGLVTVVNAEKVILDRLDKDADDALLSKEEMARVRVANELRDRLGQLANLALLVDEAHHVPTARKASGEEATEIRLRTVIHGWAARGNVTEVLGFSGTPYLEKADRFSLTDAQGGRKAFSCAGMTNVVHHFPLVAGVGVFLKRPIVRTCAGDFTAERIVEEGVRAFMARHRDTVWANGACAKLAIYAGTIARAEEEIAPLVRRLLAEYGLSEEALLIHHQGSKAFPAHPGSALAFARLDSPNSPVRIVVLVQIGKEGWDCRSLAGVVLSQEGDCNRRMVLQTACRCLREVTRAEGETAVITLNDANSCLLEAQLKTQQHTTLKAFQAGGGGLIPIRDRRARLGLGGDVALPFRQLRVVYAAHPAAPADPARVLAALDPEAFRSRLFASEGDFRSVREADVEVETASRAPEHANFWLWRCAIVKEGLDLLPMAALRPHLPALCALFDRVTVSDGCGGRVYRADLAQPEIRAAIRRAFAPREALGAAESFVLTRATLVDGLPGAFPPETPLLIPAEPEARAAILRRDAGETSDAEDKMMMAVSALREIGKDKQADQLEAQICATNDTRTFHLLPYRLDSRLEVAFFEAARRSLVLEKYGLLLLYNGDGAHTDFRIDCYERRTGEAWRLTGAYTPDFLFLKKEGARIARALIVETKGALYAQDGAFAARRAFMEGAFLGQQAGADTPRYAYRVYSGDTSPIALRAFIEDACDTFFGKEP